MVFLFFTSYFDQHDGKEINDSRLIFKGYIFSFRFLFDFFALLGAGVVTDYLPYLKIFGIFKVARIFRLGTVVTKANVHQDIKSAMILFKITFYLCLWLHLNACTFYYVASLSLDDPEQGNWYPVLDMANINESTWSREDESVIKKYLIFYYYAILILGCNELVPVNKYEMLFSYLSLLFSSILNA